ncbi:MAG TPA: TetR family transcriptional regulator [Actinomycetota bacterium]|nr:TetR family transcriptional regulator [Actinomycetota bacterium]
MATTGRGRSGDGTRGGEKATQRAASTGGSTSPRRRPSADELSPKHTGRRPGNSGSRDAILDAARREFAEHGYEGATMRAIAREADVDAALIHHFFGSKEGVFAATVEDAMRDTGAISETVAGNLDDVGERVVRMYVALWDDAERRSPLLAIIRSAVSHDDAARLLREFIGRQVLGRVAAALPRPDAALRASLVGSQLVGLAMLRYIVRVEPLASADPETVVASVAPTVQRYLTGELPAAPAPRRGRSRGKS